MRCYNFNAHADNLKTSMKAQQSPTSYLLSEPVGSPSNLLQLLFTGLHYRPRLKHLLKLYSYQSHLLRAYGPCSLTISIS
jgi:hypothetical protein